MVLQYFASQCIQTYFYRTTGARPLPSFNHTHTYEYMYIYINWSTHIFRYYSLDWHSQFRSYWPQWLLVRRLSVEECLERCKTHDACLSAESRKIYTPLCQVSSITPVTLQLGMDNAFHLYVSCFVRRGYGRWTEGMVQSQFGIQKAIAMHFTLSQSPVCVLQSAVIESYICFFKMGKAIQSIL